MRGSYVLIQITLFLFCARSVAQYNSTESWKAALINETRGLDSLVGKSRKSAMPIIAKHHFSKITEHHYPDIKEVLELDNFNKWQHPATLYIFFDSSDVIRKMNYFFSGNIPDYIADKLEDSMWWGLPSRNPNELDPKSKDGYRMEDITAKRDHGRLVIDTSWFGSIWGFENHYMNRLFWEQRKPKVKVIYSVAISSDSSLYEPRIGNFPDDIYEPVLSQGK